MQKKLILALLLTVFIAAGAFAQIGLSVGGGGLFDLSGNNGVKITLKDDKEYSGFRNTSIGGFIFFDVTYAELNVYFAHGSLAVVTVDKDGNKTVNGDGAFKSLSAMQLGFSLLGKVPFQVGEKFTFFPLLGVDYNMVISVKDEDKNKDENPGYWNQFGFLAGVGGDINLSKSLFLRMEGLFHIRLPSKNAKDAEAAGKLLAVGTDAKVKATWGMGPQIKLGIGYRF